MEIKKLYPFDVKKECTLYVDNNAHTLPEYLEIRNAQGKVFYFRYIKGSEDQIKININKPGDYTANFDADATVTELQISQPVRKLPTKERDLRTELQIQKKNLEGTPARIYAKFGILQYDEKQFENLPIPCKVFIMLHEIGHFFYSTEWKTDTFALYHFCELGYNPSNAFYTLTKILKNPQGEEPSQRINNLYNCILYQQQLTD